MNHITEIPHLSLTIRFHLIFRIELERTQEIRRQTRVIRIFPNAESCMRLISALCIEQSEEWLTGKIYLDMNLLINKEVEEEQPEMAMMKLQNIQDLTQIINLLFIADIYHLLCSVLLVLMP